MNKTDRWLWGMTEDAKNQALRFILDPPNAKDCLDNIGFIKLQIEEFNRMYPRGEL